MNYATTTIGIGTLKNIIAVVEPFSLFLGRKERVIQEPARLEFSQQYETFHDEDDPFGPMLPSRIVSETISLYISDELYATIKSSPRQKFKHHPIKIVKPDNGPVQVRLTKRYTILRSRKLD